MEILQGMFRTDPQLAEDLLRLLNEVELARLEKQKKEPPKAVRS